MANKVFANGREVACKAGAGKTICAFPDVCMTPPQTPATPPGVPIPYPNTGLASDTTDGTKSVKISGEEVGQKDKSCFKKSSGDEAGAAPKKGVKSSKNTGKVYFTSWSSDVKFEGENAVRHLDTTTNNHGSLANEAVPWPFVDEQSTSVMKDCQGDIDKEKAACSEYEPHKAGGKDVCKEAGVGSDFTRAKGATTTRTKKASADPCMAARKCRLLPFNAKPEDGIKGCCPAQTGDHIVPKSSFFQTSVDAGDFMGGWEQYKINDAPCMCLEGGSCTGSHGLRHAHHKAFSKVASGDPVPFNTEVEHCAAGAKKVAPACNQACIEAQLKEGHKKMGEDPPKDVKHSPTGKNFKGKTQELLDKIKAMITKANRPSR